MSTTTASAAAMYTSRHATRLYIIMYLCGIAIIRYTQRININNNLYCVYEIVCTNSNTYFYECSCRQRIKNWFLRWVIVPNGVYGARGR